MAMTPTDPKQQGTPRPWETIGATRIWKTGRPGGAVCIIANPECRSSSDFQEVDPGDDRWDEAMANAALIVAAVNAHDIGLKLAEAVLARIESETMAGCDCDVLKEPPMECSQCHGTTRLARTFLREAGGKG